jgi:hypothetical protein
MRVKVKTVRIINPNKTEVILVGANSYSEGEIMEIIREAFLSRRPKPKLPFKIGDKVIYTSVWEKNPGESMTTSSGSRVDYCIIESISPNKFRTGGIGYKLVSPDDGTFIVFASANRLMHYIS